MANGDLEGLARQMVAGEREMLESWLDFHRGTLLAKCEGLDDGQLATRSVPPSTLSLLGLVRHMSDVERHWFTRVFLGEEVEPRYRTRDDPDAAFNAAAAANAAEGLANFAADCERARQIVAAAGPLDSLAEGTWRGMAVSLRWILVHMVEEYARHNGHADLLRQSIDGAVG